MLITTADLPVEFSVSEASPSERVEPVSLATLKKHLKVQTTSEDDLLEAFLVAARTHVEEQTWRQCIDAIYELQLDRPPAEAFLELPRPPLVSVVAITYDAADGAEQTMDAADYVVVPSFLADGSPSLAVIDPYCKPGRIVLAAGASWPITATTPRCFRVRRVCGYGTSEADMPGTLRAAILMLAGHLYRNRHEVTSLDLKQIPLGAEALITAFKWSAAWIQKPTDGLTP